MLNGEYSFRMAPFVWSATGEMLGERVGFTATSLPDARVLVAGGAGVAGASVFTATYPFASLWRSAELYDWVSGKWTLASYMVENRSGHTATLLQDGTLLVVGGQSGRVIGAGPRSGGRTEILASAEVYHSDKDSWSATGSMAVPRLGHIAALLHDGRVLVAGGTSTRYPDAAALTAEIFDPATRSWTETAKMGSPGGSVATTLTDGTVLVTGKPYEPLADPYAELYDPSTQSWTRTKGMRAQRDGHTATLLQDGTVLVAGGAWAWGELASVTKTWAEVYDPASRSWHPVRDMVMARRGHSATLLRDGTVLVAGGSEAYYDPVDPYFRSYLDGSEIYDPRTGHWTHTKTTMLAAREWHKASLHPDGRVLVAGGHAWDWQHGPYSSGAARSAELFRKEPMKKSGGTIKPK